MKLLMTLALGAMFFSCKEETPKKPEQNQGYYNTNDGTGNYSGSYQDTYSNGSYYDYSSNGTNSFNSGYGSYDNFNSGNSTYNYGNNFDCNQLYGNNYNSQYDRYGQMQNFNSGNTQSQFNSNFGNYSNPLADCSQFNQGLNYNYNYQNPGMYSYQNALEQQNRYYDQMFENQRNMMLMQMIPGLLGALTGNQALQQQSINLQQQQQLSNPQMYSPGMGLSGFNAQFGTFQNPYFQNQGLNPQYQQGMYNQFGQYGNYQQYNNGALNGSGTYSNRNFYDDPNFSNGLSGRNSFYQPLNIP